MSPRKSKASSPDTPEEPAPHRSIAPRPSRYRALAGVLVVLVLTLVVAALGQGSSGPARALLIVTVVVVADVVANRRNLKGNT